MNLLLAALLASVMTPEAAAHEGFRPLTTEYQMPAESWMVERVIADLRRGGIAAVLVMPLPRVFGARRIEVWRKPSADFFHA